MLGVAHPPRLPALHAARTPGAARSRRIRRASSQRPLGAPRRDGSVRAVYFAIHAVLVEAGSGKPRAAWNAVVAAAVGALLLAFSSTFWASCDRCRGLRAERSLRGVSLPPRVLVGAQSLLGSPRLALHVRPRTFSLCNQATIILITPALAVLAWLGVRRLRAESPSWRPRGRTLAIGLAAFLAGLAPYLYIPIAASRHPLVDWGDPTNLGRFVDLILRKSYGTLSLPGDGLRVAGRPAHVTFREPRPGLHRRGPVARPCRCGVGMAEVPGILAWRSSQASSSQAPSSSPTQTRTCHCRSRTPSSPGSTSSRHFARDPRGDGRLRGADCA